MGANDPEGMASLAPGAWLAGLDFGSGPLNIATY